MTAAAQRGAWLRGGSRRGFVLAGVLWLEACAASRAEPAGIGAACDASADCIADDEATGQCSFVRLCVAGRCEAIGDAGTPLSRIVSCGSSSR